MPSESSSEKETPQPVPYHLSRRPAALPVTETAYQPALQENTMIMQDNTAALGGTALDGTVQDGNACKDNPLEANAVRFISYHVGCNK